MSDGGKAFTHPLDHPVSGALRFLAELLAWVAGPWAAATVSLWLVPPALLVLVALPAVCSTVGDKRQVVVATPGRARLMIEGALHAVAVLAPWVVWPPAGALAAGGVVAAAVLTGWRRSRWLWQGAPLGGGG